MSKTSKTATPKSATLNSASKLFEVLKQKSINTPLPKTFISASYQPISSKSKTKTVMKSLTTSNRVKNMSISAIATLSKSLMRSSDISNKNKFEKEDRGRRESTITLLSDSNHESQSSQS